MMMLKRWILTAVAVCAALTGFGQLPQFSPTEFSDWVYNNPAIELNRDNIIGNRVVLYTNSQGLPLTLTSPRFDALAGETIDLDVTWVTKFWQSDEFVMSKAGFTVALIGLDGVATDSVTFTPTSLSRENAVHLSLRVTRALRDARLRFASWRGDVVSSGAVRKIAAVASFKADVNLDGEVSLADVNAIIDVIVAGTGDEELARRADVNGDGEVSLADVNAVIGIIVA